MLKSAEKLFRKVSKLRRRLNSYSYKIKGPILIYQMGKVGSSSIFKSLLGYELPVPIHHTHLLNNLDAIEAQVKARYPDPDETLREIEKGRHLREKLYSEKYDCIYIITLVRDPIRRNISAFFQNIDEFIPNFKQRFESDVSVLDMTTIFLEGYGHEAPLNWFDSQMKEVFDIDVFESPFPKEKGFNIYKKENIKLLLIRLEDLDRVAETAMMQFLNIPNFRLISDNIGASKTYKDAYKSFVEEIQLPDEYIERMYSSKLSQHFYTQSELSSFIKQLEKCRS